MKPWGPVFRHKPVGQFGRVGTFSTYFSHHISTLEGGFCVTEDNELAELMRVLRAHGWTREMHEPGAIRAKYADIDPKFLFVNVGYNLRCTELQGAMGTVQLPKLRRYIEQRSELADIWTVNLVDKYGAFFGFQKPQQHGKHSWFGFSDVGDAGGAVYRQGILYGALNENGIGDPCANRREYCPPARPEIIRSSGGWGFETCQLCDGSRLYLRQSPIGG